MTAEEERIAVEQESAHWEEMARPWREELERECLERAAARERLRTDTDHDTEIDRRNIISDKRP